MTTDQPNILFMSPKRGGILQSSGFLDLKSLMALNRTCKANMIDEQSLILLIENELTRNHGVQTMEKALDFWRKMCHRYSMLKPWLERDSNSKSMKITIFNLLDASRYEVMLGKMLRAVPTQSERLQLLSEKDAHGRTLLHNTAISGHFKSLKTILSVYPESERLRAVNVQDCKGWTVLHCAALSGNFESIQTILDVYPEAERLQTLDMHNEYGEIVLHRVAESNNIECIKAVLSLYPESERLQAANRQDAMEFTVLDNMKPETRDSIVKWLSQQSENSSGPKHDM